MKIAFILLCHKNIDQINVLINKLQAFQEADIFVHYDKKYEEDGRNIKLVDNLTLISSNLSYVCDWGNNGIVKATLQLIKEVKNTGIKYDYIWLLSGQDYPICSVREIEKRLADNYGMNYVDIIGPDDKSFNRHMKMYEVYYPKWLSKDKIVVKIIKRLYLYFTGGRGNTFSFFKRNKPFEFNFYFGSQWWTLTPAAAYEILDYSELHPEVLEYFDNCLVPDECFFQSLFMNGSFNSQRLPSLTYVYWEKNKRSPEILKIENIERVLHATEKYCFARKIDFGDEGSYKLAKEIDKQVED